MNLRDTPLDPAILRRALAGFPTGVAVVTAQVGDRAVGMTVNSFTSVSLDPPLVAWCVALGTSSHDTFVAAESYAVHFLGVDHQDMAVRFAGKGDKFAGIPRRIGSSGAPLIEGLAPILDCRVWARYPGGDHTILVGEVVDLVERVQDPLVFHSGQLRRMDGIRRRPDLPEDSFAKSHLAHLLAQASHVVSGQFHALLEGYGLSVPEWRVLACLADAEELSEGDLAAMATVTQPRMAKILDRLEAESVVERRADGRDRRKAPVRLTGAGRAKLEPVAAAARAREAALLATFTEEDRATIKHVLHTLADRFEGDPA